MFVGAGIAVFTARSNRRAAERDWEQGRPRCLSVATEPIDELLDVKGTLTFLINGKRHIR